MKKATLLFIIGLLTCNTLFAQHARFITSGSIVYEKLVNIYAISKKEFNNTDDQFSQMFLEQYKNTHSQFVKMNSTLTFSEGKTLYTPIVPETIEEVLFNNPMGMQPNTVYTDLAASTSVIQKNVYNEWLLVKDSTRKINWKITDETREVAGYTCRRANALVMDSVYVVAFYTDKIRVAGGPETFTGLPGMILGLAIPHENVSWFATKVTDVTIPVTTITPPKKGKAMNNKQMHDELQKAMKGWGAAGLYELKVFSL